MVRLTYKSESDLVQQIHKKVFPSAHKFLTLSDDQNKNKQINIQ